jgi:uroporphyrinogen decarboxylase
MNETFTPRERILAAIEHREPDWVPIDVGGCSTTTLIGDAYERLKRLLAVNGETEYMKRKSLSVFLDEAVADRLHSDTRGIMVGGPDNWKDVVLDDGSFQDEFGVIWRKAEGGKFNPLGNPLRHASLADLKSYPFPDPLDAGRVRGLREKARQLHEQTGHAVILTMPSGFVHLSTYLRGFDNFLIDFAADHEFLEALLDRTCNFFLELTARLVEEVDPYVDVIMYGDDLAFQNAPMVDLKRYRRFIKPLHKALFDIIKTRSRAKLLYHCCGAARSMIGDFIDLGVNALNPVQVSSAGMNTAELKAEFGSQICFWGAIDTQHVLPVGSPQDVREEVRRRIQDLAPGGGYVLASVHNIQEDVPAENILAMVDAAREFGQYPLKATN